MTIGYAVYSSAPLPLVNDSLQCVQCLTSVSQKGREHLWQFDTLLALCRCFRRQQKGNVFLVNTVKPGEIFTGQYFEVLMVLTLLK